MKTAPILLYGGDTRYKGKRLGLESLRRRDQVVQIIADNREYQFTIIVAPGSNPDHPEYPPLKELMQASLLREFKKLKDAGKISYTPRIILVKENVWNTAQESLAAALLLEKLGIKEVIVISSWYHITRIQMIWRMIGGFTVHAVSAPSDRYSAVFREMIAIAKVAFVDRKFLIKKKLPTLSSA